MWRHIAIGRSNPLILYLVVLAALIASGGRGYFAQQYGAYYGNDEIADDGSNDPYPPRLKPQLKNVCVLGTVDNYVDWWQHANGTLNVPAGPNETYYLDLSHTWHNNSDADSIGDAIRLAFPHQSLSVNADPRSTTAASLLVLSLAYGELDTVPHDALALVNATMEFLTLRGNRFHRTDADERPPWDAFPALPVLRELDLTGCRISIVTPDSFVGMPELQRLYLGNNRIETLSPATFDQLGALFHLDLSYNFATDDASVPPATSQGLFVAPSMFNFMESLLLLDLSYTAIYENTAVRGLAVLPPNLELFSLCYTSMPQLPQHIFLGTRLKVLDLSGNPTLAFNMRTDSLHQLAATLQILAMDDANLRTLEFFCTLNRLRVLLLSGNNVNQLYANALKGLDRLEMLDLSANHLGNWYQPALAEHTPRLQLLKLHNNNINLITPAMFRDFQQLKFLAIGNNEFICSCSLREFMDVASANSRHTIDCPLLHPHLRRRINVSAQLSAQVLEHYRSHGLAPPRVLHAAVQRPYDVGVRLHVDDMMLVAESVGNMTVVKNKIIVPPLKQPADHLKHHRRKRHTSSRFPFGHSDEEDEDELPPPLEYVTTKRIGDEIMNFTFQLLDYHDNRYKCIDQKTSEKFHLNEIESCAELDGDVYLEEVNPELLQHEKTMRIVGGVLGSILGFMLVLSVVYYYWWYIRFVWMTLRNSAIMGAINREQRARLVEKRKRRGEDGGEEGDDEDDGRAPEGEGFAYDVFVSYCESNRDWILEEFLPNMDQCSDIRVCLHERDFQVGLSILENIIHSMDRSRCILLVVSESFLRSQWCQFEMHLAQHRLLETSRDQLILILLEDIPRRKRSQTLHYLMRTKTYIKWPTSTPKTTAPKDAAAASEKHDQIIDSTLRMERRQFWRRLKRALAENEWETERRNGKIVTAL